MEKRYGLDAISYLNDVAGSSGITPAKESPEVQQRRIVHEIHRKQAEISKLAGRLQFLETNRRSALSPLERLLRRLGLEPAS